MGGDESELVMIAGVLSTFGCSGWTVGATRRRVRFWVDASERRTGRTLDFAFRPMKLCLTDQLSTFGIDFSEEEE